MSMCTDTNKGGGMNSDQCVSRIVHQEKVDLAKSQDLGSEEVEQLCQLFKAFSEPGRLRILHALLHQRVNQVNNHLGIGFGQEFITLGLQALGDAHLDFVLGELDCHGGH